MHVYRSSQHVAKLVARPGTRHQRKTASNYAGSSILLLQPASPPQAASHASKQARRDASHAKQEQGLLSCPVPRKKKMHAPRNRFWRLGRLRASLPIGPLAFSPVGAKIFLLLFFLSPGGGVVVNGQDGRARCVCCLRCGGRAPLSTGVGFRFTPCLLAVARETLDFRRGRCRQPNSNLLTPRVLVPHCSNVWECADLLRLSSSKGAGYPFLQDRKVTCARPNGRGMYHQQFITQLACLRFYGCNLESIDGFLSVSVRPSRVVNPHNLFTIDMSLSRLSASSLRRLLAGKTPARLG